MDNNWTLSRDAVAHHEAGHALAAALCAVQWTSVRIRVGNGWALHSLGRLLGQMRYAAGPDDPADGAFIYWAGSYAEARAAHARDDPALWGQVRAAQENVKRGDMVLVRRYWNDPTHAPHTTEQQWADELELAWPQVCELAERLLDAPDGVVYTDGGADLEKMFHEVIAPFPEMAHAEHVASLPDRMLPADPEDWPAWRGEDDD